MEFRPNAFIRVCVRACVYIVPKGTNCYFVTNTHTSHKKCHVQYGGTYLETIIILFAQIFTAVYARFYCANIINRRPCALSRDRLFALSYIIFYCTRFPLPSAEHAFDKILPCFPNRIHLSAVFKVYLPSTHTNSLTRSLFVPVFREVYIILPTRNIPRMIINCIYIYIYIAYR